MHTAIILDGNRSYAKKMKMFPRFRGHLSGKKNLEKILLYWAKNMKEPKHLTLYVFSLHNLKKRKLIEKTFIFSLLQAGFRELLNTDEIYQHEINVSFAGDKKSCPPRLRKTIEELETRTKHFKKKFLTFCVCYDGQEEIVQAFNQMSEKKIKNSSIDEIKQHLYTKKLPPVDLLIRTGGEKRISGFLLWDVSYAELMFKEEFWPEYSTEMFEQDLKNFRQRERRFGK